MDFAIHAMETIIGSLAMLSVPGYVALQIWLPISLKDGWRRAAFLPLFFAVPLLAWCAVALVAGSNLWPLAFILFAPMGAAYLILLYCLSWLLRRPKAQS